MLLGGGKHRFLQDYSHFCKFCAVYQTVIKVLRLQNPCGTERAKFKITYLTLIIKKWRVIQFHVIERNTKADSGEARITDRLLLINVVSCYRHIVVACSPAT